MRPSPLAQSLHRALILLGSLVGILGTGVLVIRPGPNEGWAVLFYTLVFWTYLVAGLIAWWRRPGNGCGAIMVVGGLAVLGAGLGTSSVPALGAVGSICATVVLAVLVHLLHAFPSGRVRGGAPAAIVIAAYTTSLVLEAPSYLFGHDAAGPLFITSLPPLVALADVSQRIAGVLIAATTAVVLLRRLRDADSEHRRVLVPLFAYGLFAVLFIPFSTAVLEDIFGVSAWTRGLLQLAVLGGAPIAFTLGMLLGGFTRTAGLSELGNWIGSGGGERSTLVRALARTVGDPGLEVAYWVPDRGIHVTADGTPLGLPEAGERRAAIGVEVEGRRVGAVIYDAALIAHGDQVRDAARLVAIALDRQRLTAELHASERALAESRARIARADAAAIETEGGVSQLTVRQREVLALIAQGRSNAAIARALVLTEKSVVNHVSRIFDVLDLPIDADDHRRVLATIRFLGR